MREYSTPASVDIPPSASLTDVVFERAASDPGRVVMRRKSAAGDGAWQYVTARQFADDVTALAKGLIATGIEVGDRVALMSRTRYEWTVIDYAIWAAGATASGLAAVCRWAVVSTISAWAPESVRIHSTCSADDVS